jgi:hypothetical protein
MHGPDGGKNYSQFGAVLEQKIVYDRKGSVVGSKQSNRNDQMLVASDKNKIIGDLIKGG